MDAIGKYIISIISAAIICGMLTSLVSGKACSGIIRVLCGIFLSVTVVSPLAKIQLNDMEQYLDTIQIDAQTAALTGEETANQETSAIIKRELEAYIIEKAESLKLSVSVQITMTDDFPPQPQAVVLIGSVSPYNKKILTNYITSDLGIPEENQTWK